MIEETTFEADAAAQLTDFRRFANAACVDWAAAIPLGIALFWATLRSQRRRRLMGIVWLFLPSAAAALAAGYAQSKNLFSIQAPGMPYPLFVFTGMTLWQVFVEALNAPLRQLTQNRALLGRVRFPHESLWVAGAADLLLNATARIVAMFVVYALYMGWPAPGALLIPLDVVSLIILGMGIGLLLAPLALLWDDISSGLMFVVNFAVFAMPVAYPIRSEGWQRFNPLLPLIDAPRAWLLGRVPVGNLAGSIMCAIVVAGFGLFGYRVARPHLVSRIT